MSNPPLPTRKPDTVEILTGDQLGQALQEYCVKHRSLVIAKRVVYQLNTIHAPGGDGVTVRIWQEDVAP